jgi:hypothetical protein
MLECFHNTLARIVVLRSGKDLAASEAQCLEAERLNASNLESSSSN